jgi:hypothetical protein
VVNRRVDGKSIVFASRSVGEEVGERFMENADGVVLTVRNVEQRVEET